MVRHFLQVWLLWLQKHLHHYHHHHIKVCFPLSMVWHCKCSVYSKRLRLTYMYMKAYPSIRKIFVQQDSCLTDCKFLLDKTQFCRTVLYVIIVIWVIFAGHLSDSIKYFVSQNEILLVLTDRPAIFVKTVFPNYYTPGIYADGYIVFAFPFVRSYVR